MQYPKRPASLKVTISRQLRQDATPAEKAVWQLVRNRRFLGLKFRRQHVIDGFIADFYCPALRLILEVDGSSHDDYARRANDAARTDHFARTGRRVVRIRNHQVCESALVAAITSVLSPGELSALARLNPSPFNGEGRGEANKNPSPCNGEGQG